MNSREKINSIKCVINGFYHDMKCKGNLTECANECWKEYQQFCEDIKKNLDRLEILQKIFNKLQERGLVYKRVQSLVETANPLYEVTIGLTQKEVETLRSIRK